MLDWRTIYKCKDGLITIVTPLILSPLLIFNYSSTESRCAFVVVLMAVYWIFQPIPLPVTALLPVALFPLLGLATTSKACEPYLQSTNMLFMASLIIAIAMENSGFHKRIALKTLLLIGNDLRNLFAGFMFTTMFLGIWIINTAATAMILPIADVVVEELFSKSSVDIEEANEKDSKKEDIRSEQVELLEHPSPVIYDIVSNGKKPNQDAISRKLNYIRKLLYICIAYSATIGGTTTLTSNGPNLVFQFVLDELYSGLPNVDYTKWLLFCIPCTVLSVLFSWIIMTNIYLKKNVINQIKKSPKNALEIKYKELGPITFHEIAVCLLFLILILLWMFRNPQFLPGWVTLLGTDIKPKDTTPAILIVILMFCIPNNPLGPYPSESLLDWKVVQSKLAWGVILLRGGGFSMADTASSSGLTALIAKQLVHLNDFPVYIVITIISLLASFTTELASNSAIATIFLPISGQIASNLNQNPLLFLIPVTLSCSYAFIFPVGTPANALVSSHAKLKPSDMIIPGILIKIVCILFMLTNLYITGFPMFSLNTLPSWSMKLSNTTRT